MLKLRYSQKDEIAEIGFDEAGRGCFFGPIMAGAVLLPPQEKWPIEFTQIASKIKDSKKITPKRRKEYFDVIRKCLVGFFGIGHVGADEINEMGIQWANREAFRRALGNLIETQGVEGGTETGAEASVRLLVDGEISFHGKDGVSLPFSQIEEKLIIEGDGTYLAIATASILAKVAHDEWIQEWCGRNTELSERYGMSGCKGYGTASHREGLKKWGACVGHRMLFIRNWIPRSFEQDIDVDSSIKPKPKNSIESCLIKL